MCAGGAGAIAGYVIGTSIYNTYSDIVYGPNGSYSEEDDDGDPVEDVLEGAEAGDKTKGRTKNFTKPGGMDQANDDFDMVVPGGGSPIDPDDAEAGRKGESSKGQKVTVRPNSTDGRPTLEILEGKNRIKVRYDE